MQSQGVKARIHAWEHTQYCVLCLGDSAQHNFFPDLFVSLQTSKFHFSLEFNNILPHICTTLSLSTDQYIDIGLILMANFLMENQGYNISRETLTLGLCGRGVMWIVLCLGLVRLSWVSCTFSCFSGPLLHKYTYNINDSDRRVCPRSHMYICRSKEFKALAMWY